MFLFQYLSSIEGIKADYELSFVNYIVVILVMGLIIFFVAGWDYTRLYTNVYSESANSRIDIANRLKKLPRVTAKIMANPKRLHRSGSSPKKANPKTAEKTIWV